MQQPSEVTDISCTQCGCVCDDLTLQISGQTVTSFLPDCALARPWFASLNWIENQVTAEIKGHPASLPDAVAMAVQLLRNSRSPLIYGLSRSSTAGQRAACELADRIGATIDTTASTCHAPSIMALQYVGEETCTLGEIRNRSDLVIYWGSNPLESHPRHFSRIVETPGQFVPNGRRDRHVVVVDIQPTASSDAADTFLQVQPGTDFEVLWTLRALVDGQTVASDSVGGIPVKVLQDLADRMRSSRYGAVFFGLGLTFGPVGHQNVEALLQLVTQLTRHTRFVARRMRVMGDVAGADSVLCWQTGYPFSVSLNREYPRFNPGEFTASGMLERDEVDCLLLVGGEGIEKMSPAAQASARSLPTILLDYPNAQRDLRPTVRLTTAIYGVHRPGVAYRMDEVPIRLRPFLKSSLPSDDEVLRSIIDGLDTTSAR